MFHDDADGEHESVAVVRRCLRPTTTLRTRAPCPIGNTPLHPVQPSPS
jgi:hypothetical protein